MSEVIQATRDYMIEQAEGPIGYRDYLILAGIYKQAHPELDRGSQSLVHFKESLEHLSDPANPNTGLLLARQARLVGNRVVGAAMLYVMGEQDSDARGTVIEEIFVDKRLRGNNIGKLLLTSVVDFAQEHGSKTVLLGSEPQTEGAHRLFKNMSFTENRWGKLSLSLEP